MERKKTLVIVFAAMLSAAGYAAVIDKVYDESQKIEKEREIPNPEKTARKRTDDMDKVLNLTDKQYKKIYKLYLKEEKDKVEKMFSHANVQPPMNGRRPPMGMGQPPMGGGFPPMRGERPDFVEGGPGMMPEHFKEKMAEAMKEREEKMLKKIRKILTKEQYGKWLSVEHDMPGKPGPVSPCPKPRGL